MVNILSLIGEEHMLKGRAVSISVVYLGLFVLVETHQPPPLLLVVLSQYH